jgi:hypothetical protein
MTHQQVQFEKPAQASSRAEVEQPENRGNETDGQQGNGVEAKGFQAKRDDIAKLMAEAAEIDSQKSPSQDNPHLRLLARYSILSQVGYTQFDQRSTMMVTKSSVVAARDKFFQLAHDGKKAALDMSVETAELACLYTQGDAGEGAGTPGQTYTAQWIRLAVCEDGRINGGKT